MVEVAVIVSLLFILLILFWPRRSGFVRSVTSSRNGHPRRFGD